MLIPRQLQRHVQVELSTDGSISRARKMEIGTMIKKVEIGGGTLPKPGFINVDRCATADYIVDLETEPLPFETSSVDEIYSSHCLEHIRNLIHVISEITRISKPNARVEIRVPHWGQEMATCFDHKQTISEDQARHFSEAKDFWCGGHGSLVLVSTKYTPNGHFNEAKRLFRHLTDEQIFRFVQNTCHEIVFEFTAVKP